MRHGLRLAAVVAAFAVTGTAGAAQRSLAIDRGVVQSVGPGQIVLRELDGSTVALTVGNGTRVRLNGLPALITDIQPGFVAAVLHNGSAPARLVRAFGRVQLATATGQVAAASATAITVRLATGQTATFRITARTVIRVRGLPAGPAAIRAGRPVTVVHTQAGEARRIAVRALRI